MFDPSQPGMNGLGDLVITDTEMRQPWISYNVYLKKYLMTFVGPDGWYYSVMSDIEKQDWTPPEKFLIIPGESNWTDMQPTWEDMVFVTPSFPPILNTTDYGPTNHVTGQDGLVIFTAMPCWGGGKECHKKGQEHGRYFVVARYHFK